MAICAFRYPSTDSTNQYLYRWDDGRWGTCDCSVLQKKRGRGRGRAGPGRDGIFVCYTTFSIPGSGCWMGPVVSMLPACWASCKTGMLHSGHTFLTSSHLMRHLGDRQAERRDGGQSREQAGKKMDSFTSDIISVSTVCSKLHDLSTGGQRSFSLQKAPPEGFYSCHCQNVKS